MIFFVGATPPSRKASQTTTHRPEGGAPTKCRASPCGLEFSLYERRPRRDQPPQTTNNRPEGGAPTS